ncbi:hypothetical protein L0F63_005950 [Massospora cicadina]|nr:hypothetical protein L0F63_005950 [Massospora cicadina]
MYDSPMSECRKARGKCADSVRSFTASTEPSREDKQRHLMSKRAAQNRAAQKAFRQRKVLYIKDLEDKAKTLSLKEAALRASNSKVAQLQTRLQELEGENIRLRKSLNIQSNKSPPTRPTRILAATDLGALFDVLEHRVKFPPTLPLSTPNETLAPSQASTAHPDLFIGFQCPNCGEPINSPNCLCPRPPMRFPMLAGRKFKWFRTRTLQGLWRWHLNS